MFGDEKSAVFIVIEAIFGDEMSAVCIVRE